jgi:ribosomal protein S18 acetylase RimI-like enzyme
MNKLRVANRNDLKIIVDIHIKAFPEFFLTKLGSRFTYKYYNLILNYEKKIFLVIEKDGYPIGFAAGFLHPSSFYAYVRKHKNILIFALIPVIFRNPFLIPRIISNFCSTKKKEKKNKAIKCELASIAVNPDYAGQGLGKKLVKAFIEISQKRKVDAVCLTTDVNNNGAVNNFYQSLGFSLYRTFIAPGNRLMNEYRFILRNS